MQGQGNSLGPFFGVIGVLVRTLRAAGRLRFPGAPRLDERLSMRRTSLTSGARLVRAGLAFGAGSLAVLALASPALADKIKNPTAIFAGLDKITGRIISFEAAVDETVQFGSLQLTARICYSRPEYENPQTTTFVEVEEVGADNQYKKIFAGWMFASSPGLNAIEHPVYDIWLAECKGGKDIIKTPPEQEDADDPPAPLSAEAKKPPKPAEPIKRRDAATNAPLRLPDATGLGSPVPPTAAAPRAQPQQRFFPTTSGAGRGAAYDPVGSSGR